MADKKISQLTGATTPVAGTEVLPIVQGGSTVKVSIANLTAGRSISSAGASLDGAVTINDSGADVDMRVEGDTDANLLFVDASTDRIGVGENLPNTKVTILGPGTVLSGSTTYDLQVKNSSTAYGIRLGQDGTNGTISGIGTSGLSFWTYNGSAWGERFKVTATGNLGIGAAAPAQKLEVAGNLRFSGSQVGTKIQPRQTAISVTTSATPIVDDAGGFGSVVIVNGADGGDRFCDLLFASTAASPTVIASFAAFGSPAARTYTRNGGALELAMASGTYDVYALVLGY